MCVGLLDCPSCLLLLEGLSAVNETGQGQNTAETMSHILNINRIFTYPFEQQHLADALIHSEGNRRVILYRKIDKFTSNPL